MQISMPHTERSTGGNAYEFCICFEHYALEW